MVPFAHWITPTFAPRRFDTWFFLAEAPEGKFALHDGSESVDSVWIGAQQAIDEATAGRRTLVHATTMILELLAEGGTVTGAISQASEIARSSPSSPQAKAATANASSTSREGYRNWVREMPPTAGRSFSSPSRFPRRGGVGSRPTEGSRTRPTTIYPSVAV